MKRRNLKQRSLFLPLLAGLWLFQMAWALPEDRNLPVDIVSDTGEYFQEEGYGIYTGNVVLTQGTLEIKADKATFYLKEGALDYVVAESLQKGKLVKIKYLPNHDDPWVFGEGKTLHYYPNKELLTLLTNAEVIQANDVVKAEQIDYRLDTKKVTASRSKKEQIKITIQTGKGAK
ncbi:lipopolysaccharide transport periplasmic protein LptA [Ignatzschineria sp. RMDPL8A]|uniref:lipopolysaccharide transport periplasmic protein LptA n=1 Tax=Ignatzschineria sp. RMDPL8A TaxID=2999236 RepID=UPI0024466810|nr:lipopolysaccharide transport periplasmic protein LptA [Ignatzschineria sp. RMDPL8A]MDG9729266.1 lipopolysaccharide transport periplasmic protein LptA [Ignatzschineria sp. RMDPL8A]